MLSVNKKVQTDGSLCYITYLCEKQISIMASFRSLTHFLLTITVFLLTSCNDDVFIDRPDLTGDVGVTIMEPHEIKNVSYEQTGLSTLTVEVEREASFMVVAERTVKYSRSMARR